MSNSTTQPSKLANPGGSPANVIGTRTNAEKLAPIALFVYNRPDHTRQTLLHLRANHLAPQSSLFVFADGAKDESSAQQVNAVRKLVRAVDGFRTVTIIERDRNLGLSASIISGVTQLCAEYGRAIVAEDDVLTAPDFLTFLNLALDRYALQSRVFSIGGFNLPIPVPATHPYDAFFSYRFMCWGWGTWRDRWEKADWSVSDYPQFASDPELQKRFNRGGSDCSWLLARHMAGKIDSWDTVWAYMHSKHDAVALLPTISKVQNIGFDGSGTHCRRSPFAQTALIYRSDLKYRIPDSTEVDTYFATAIQRLRDRSLVKRLARFLRDRFGCGRKESFGTILTSQNKQIQTKNPGTALD